MSDAPHEEQVATATVDSESPQEVSAPVVKTLPPEARQRALQAELMSLLDVVGPTPLIDLLMERAFELGGTDIHLDPRPDGLAVRLRLDGMLHDIMLLDPQYAPQVVSRIKLLSGMNITERRVSQDGRISKATARFQRDIRVGSGPTIHGERIVMRLMADSAQYTELQQLGMDDDQVAIVQQALRSVHGVTLSVGPVGCGKSTTTYACLNLLNDPMRSLVSIEDPVERRLERVNQIQVDTKIGFGFVEALRGVLRQDPDVIMVGEIRDAETAHIAIRAGLTGTCVLSTLHAGDTGATIDMFREFQIPRMFLADSIKCVIAQRLLRRVCEKDRESHEPDAAMAEFLKLSDEERHTVRLVRGIPTDANFHTGYFGRTGIFEVMSMDSEIRELVLAGKPGRSIYDLARERGMKSLEDSARAKILAGITTFEEVMRVMI